MRNILNAMGITLVIMVVSIVLTRVFKLILFEVSIERIGTSVISMILVGVIYFLLRLNEHKNKIIKEKEENKKRVSEKRTKEQKEEKRLINLLYYQIDKRAEDFNIKKYLKHINYPLLKVGDKAIVNKYGLFKHSGNYWDKGASQLINYADTNKPIIVNVTGVGVETSYAKNQADDYIKFRTFRNDVIDDDIITRFFDHLRCSVDDNAIATQDGLYVNVLFDTISIDFNPSWGLNIFSFLPFESKAGQRTFEVWNCVYKNNKKLSKAKETENILIKKVNDLENNLYQEFK